LSQVIQNNLCSTQSYRQVILPVLLNFQPFLRLLFGSKNVFPLHSDLKTLAQATMLAEASIGQIHSTPFIIQALEVILQQQQSLENRYHNITRNMY
jgi:hypothetical protein